MMKNPFKNPTRRTAATLASLAAAVALVGTTMTIATPAQARVAYTFKICAHGNYAAYAEVPQQGISTYVAQPGSCTQVPLSSSSTYAKVWGLWNTHPQDRFYVGTAHFNGAAGWTGGAKGTTTSPYLVNYN